MTRTLTPCSPSDRRARLIEWARPQGTLVVEYEADADYHYDHEPIASLKAPSGAPRSDFT